MEFSTLLFILFFFPAFLFSYFIFKNRKYRNIILLIFSLLFYAWGEVTFVFLMIASIIINYYLAIMIDKSSKKKLWLIISIIINLSFLGIFKYTGLLLSSINSIFSFNIGIPNIILPIGISFYTFQIMSYVIDVYRKKVNVQKNILYLGCYIASFPQLIAGPIVTYETIEKELENRKENIKDFASGIRRFIIGLSKKVLLANSLGFIVDTLVNSGSSSWSFIIIWIIIISYTLQIYYDFSAYSDMAIGMGLMIGFKYKENFNYPYISKSITDFWRRWHISLSSWFRDYLYIPLGGNRCKKIINIRNILIVWALTGLWHGASYNFIIWGLYYGLLLILEKFVLKNIIAKWPDFIKSAYTIILVMIGWLIFRMENLNDLIIALKSMIGLNGFGGLELLYIKQIFQIKYIIFIVAAIYFAKPRKIKLSQNITDYLLLALFLIDLFLLVVGSYNPFIYYRF